VGIFHNSANQQPCPDFSGDEGSAARFFYTAKAGSDDRLGSKHPTVKPLDLMQYLVRLICQPNGLVLDPFAGTGTTGEAAFREGMRAVLIECEAEYLKDIERRIELLMAGPDERAFRSQKAKQSGKPQDSGPLFGGKSDWDEMWAQPFDRTDLL
jgi:site-specific DNA-methyltransferase (adenine-specific)